ncbi:hypothetical protein CPAV1605_1197 [seawater metagenome]|uniref:Uncharacterized protein n=1 Tax=seawater metagenome TaxID=1561972 RepID=A0A5E8CJU0_9ZZZZ
MIGNNNFEFLPNISSIFKTGNSDQYLWPVGCINVDSNNVLALAWIMDKQSYTIVGNALIHIQSNGDYKDPNTWSQKKIYQFPDIWTGSGSNGEKFLTDSIDNSNLQWICSPYKIPDSDEVYLIGTSRQYNYGLHYYLAKANVNDLRDGDFSNVEFYTNVGFLKSISISTNITSNKEIFLKTVVLMKNGDNKLYTSGTPSLRQNNDNTWQWYIPIIGFMEWNIQVMVSNPQKNPDFPLDNQWEQQNFLKVDTNYLYPNIESFSMYDPCFHDDLADSKNELILTYNVNQSYFATTAQPHLYDAWKNYYMPYIPTFVHKNTNDTNDPTLHTSLNVSIHNCNNEKNKWAGGDGSCTCCLDENTSIILFSDTLTGLVKKGFVASQRGIEKSGFQNNSFAIIKKK